MRRNDMFEWERLKQARNEGREEALTYLSSSNQ